MHHVDGDVTLFAIAEGVAHANGFADHCARVFGNALAVESGLGNLALRAMLCAFGGDHAFAEKHFAALDCAFFDEIVVLNDEEFADVVRVVEIDDVIPSDLVVGDIAVRVDEVLEEGDRIGGTKPAEGKPEEVALKAWRKAVCAAGILNVVAGGGGHEVSVNRGAVEWSASVAR